MLGATILAAVAAQAPAVPSRSNVEAALLDNNGLFCRNLIDACLDQDGNDINPTPRFTVSDLDCRPAAHRRATCSFTSVKSFGPDQTQPSQRCTGTLVRYDGAIGGASWTFFVPDVRRHPNSALLSCN